MFAIITFINIDTIRNNKEFFLSYLSKSRSDYALRYRVEDDKLRSIAGGVLNIALNLLLIPPFGAMGASVAPFASYFAVCLLRLVTGRRLIPFKGEWGRLIGNTLLMGALTAVVTLSERNVQYMFFMYGGAAGVFVLLAAFNIRPILELLRDGKRILRGR